MGEQLLIACGGGDGWGVICGLTVPLWGESTRERENDDPCPPWNELKKFGDAESITV